MELRTQPAECSDDVHVPSDLQCDDVISRWVAQGNKEMRQAQERFQREAKESGELALEDHQGEEVKGKKVGRKGEKEALEPPPLLLVPRLWQAKLRSPTLWQDERQRAKDHR